MELLTKKVNSNLLYDKSPLLSSYKLFSQSNKKYADRVSIAGGAARFLFDNKTPFNDVDIYVMGNADRWDAASNIYEHVRQHLHRHEIDFTEQRGVPTIKCRGHNIDLQVITFKEVSSIDELFESYDFTCCQFALVKDALFFTADAQDHHIAKELWWTPSALNNEQGYNLENRFWRVQKYLKKGYRLGEGQGDAFFDMPWDENLSGHVAERVRRQTSGSDNQPMEVQEVPSSPQRFGALGGSRTGRVVSSGATPAEAARRLYGGEWEHSYDWGHSYDEEPETATRAVYPIG